MPSQMFKLLLAVLIFFTAPSSFAAEFSLVETGLRGGVSYRSYSGIDFEQFEGYASFGLPWEKRWDSGWSLGTRLQATAGALHGEGSYRVAGIRRKIDRTGLVGTVGPRLVFAKQGGNLLFELGSRLTYLSIEEFGRHDFGGPFQFTSEIGLSYLLSSAFKVGYQFQHMSNAGMYSPNPGLEMHMVEVAYRF